MVVDIGDDLHAIRAVLKNAGFKIRAFTSAASALDRALDSAPSMFILDTDIVGGDGLELCRQIRETAGLSLIPILQMSRRSQEADVVAGLQAGADDYIVKPFRERELLARVNASLRRCYELSQPRLTRFDAVEINSEAITLTVHGQRKQLRPAEFKLLDYMVRNPGRVFSRDHLLSIIQSRPRSVKCRMIDVIVRQVRDAIEPDPAHPRYLRTASGFGYCFYLPENATGVGVPTGPNIEVKR